MLIALVSVPVHFTVYAFAEEVIWEVLKVGLSALCATDFACREELRRIIRDDQSARLGFGLWLRSGIDTGVRYPSKIAQLGVRLSAFTQARW